MTITFNEPMENVTTKTISLTGRGRKVPVRVPDVLAHHNLPALSPQRIA